VPHAQAAVHRDDRPGDVPGVGRGQERDGRRDLVRGREVMSVSTKPGATTLTVIDLVPSSLASERAMPIRPALDAA
jgi:hypothetical protein